MNEKNILDIDQIPQNKKRLKWGKIVLEAEDVLWKGKPLDRLPFTIYTFFFFLYLIGIWFLCLKLELDAQSRQTIINTIFVFVPSLGLTLYLIYKNNEQAKTEYVITEEALHFRMFHQFRIKAFSIPYKEIKELTLEKFSDTNNATIHIHTNRELSFKTQTYDATLNPYKHFSIEHVNNFEEAFELLKTFCQGIPVNNKKSILGGLSFLRLRFMRALLYLILIGMTIILIDFCLLPHKIIDDEIISSTWVSSNTHRYESAKGFSFTQNAFYPHPVVEIETSQIFKFMFKVQEKGTSFVMFQQRETDKFGLKIFISIIYWIILLLSFTVAKRFFISNKYLTEQSLVYLFLIFLLAMIMMIPFS